MVLRSCLGYKIRFRFFLNGGICNGHIVGLFFVSYACMHVGCMYACRHSQDNTIGCTEDNTNICSFLRICIYIYTHVHAYIYIYVLLAFSYMHTCMHAYIHIYIHTHIHTYMHAYIHIYIHRDPVINVSSNRSVILPVGVRLHTYIHTDILT